MRLSPVLLALCGCSSMLDLGEPVIICHATKEPVQCPTEPGDARRAVEVFSTYVMPLDPDEALEIHWYDWDHRFEDSGDVTGYTDINSIPTRVHVRNHRVLMHELAHVAFWRETGDADANHEKAPGPWGQAINEAVQKAAAVYGVTNPVGEHDDVLD